MSPKVVIGEQRTEMRGHSNGATEQQSISKNYCDTALLHYCSIFLTSYFLLLTSYGALIAADWTAFRGNPARTAFVQEQAYPQLHHRWSFEVPGAIVSSPIVYRGRVYFGSRSGSIYALDAYTGEIFWDYSTGGNIDSSPAAFNNRIYVASRDGNLYCFDSDNGFEPLWTFNTGGRDISSPVIYKNRIYGASGHPNRFVYALDAISGEFHAKYRTEGFVFSSLSIHDNTLYFGSTDGRFYALDANTLAKRWSAQTIGSVYMGTVLAAATAVYFIPGDDDKHLYAFNPNTGALLWSSIDLSTWSIAAYASSPAGSDDDGDGSIDTLYVASGGETQVRLYAINVGDGSIRWSRDIGRSTIEGVLSSPIVVNDVVYIGSGDGYLYSICASTGGLIAKHNLGSPIVGSPTVANGWLYVGTMNGILWAFEASRVSSISSPENGAQLVGSVEIRGSAFADNFTSYILEYRKVPSGPWTQIDSGSTAAVSRGLLGVWDTKSLLQGEYQLRVTVLPNNNLRNYAVMRYTVIQSSIAWASAESSGTAVAFGDYDSDGFLDTLVARHGHPNSVLRNNGNRTFTAVWTAPVSENSTVATWGDYDNDGDLDILIANYGQPNRVWRNDGGGAFSSVWVSDVSENSTGATWGDYDNDGDLDILIANYGQPNRVWRNTGVGFELLWSSTGTFATRSVAFGDFNNDGLLDFVSGNNGSNRVYRNTGGGFELFWSSAEMDDTHSVAFGDYDNDGLLDFGSGNNGSNRVYRNTVSGFELFWSSIEANDTRSVAFGDYDNDGDLDIAESTTRHALAVFRNNRVESGHIPNAPLSPPVGLSANFKFSAGISSLTFTWDPSQYDAGNSSHSVYFQLAVSTAPMSLSVDGRMILPSAGFVNTPNHGSPLMGNFIRNSVAIWPGEVAARHGAIIKGNDVTSETSPVKLSTDMTYYYRVQSIDGGLSRSLWSEQRTVNTNVEPSAAIDLTASPGANPWTITLTWSIAGDDMNSGSLAQGSHFRIQHSTSSESDWHPNNAQIVISTSGVHPRTMVTHNIENLSAGVTYYFRIWQADEVGNLSSISNVTSSWAQRPPPPTPPSKFHGIAVSSHAIRWEWELNVNASYYLLMSSAGLLLANIGGTNATTYLEVGLSANTLYERHIYSGNDLGISSYPAVGARFTLANPPSDFIIVERGWNYVLISWSGNGNPPHTKYRLYRSTDGLNFTSIVSTTAFAFRDYGLSQLTTYFYRISSLNSDSISTQFYSTISIRTLEKEPPAPVGFAGTAISTESIKWVWNISQRAAYYQLSSTSGVLISQLGSTVTYYIETGLNPNTLYSRYLIAGNEGGISTSSVRSIHTLAKPPDTLALSSATAHELEIRWNTNGASRFRIIYSTTADYSASRSLGWDAQITTSPYTLRRLTPATTYFVSLFGYNADGLVTETSAAVTGQTRALEQTVFSPENVAITTHLKIADGVAIEIKVDILPNSLTGHFYLQISDDPINKAIAVDGRKILTANRKLMTDPRKRILDYTIVELVLRDYETGDIIKGNLSRAAVITVSYPDSNNDGIVDGTAPPVYEKTLQLFTLDEVTDEWRFVRSNLDAKNNRVSAETPHLSVFALISNRQAALNLSNVRVFPNPYRPGTFGAFDRQSGIRFDNLTENVAIRIFNLSGELVFEREHFNPVGYFDWHAVNNRGDKVASGVYFYILTNPVGENVRGKLAIIR